MVVELMRVAEMPDDSKFPFEGGWMAWRKDYACPIGCFAASAEEAVGALAVQEYHKGRLEDCPGIKDLVQEEYLKAVSEDGMDDTSCIGWVGTRLIRPQYPEDEGLVRLTVLVVEPTARWEEFRG